MLLKSIEFQVLCHGRDMLHRNALLTPVVARVTGSNHEGSNTFSTRVTCPYNHGGKGERCNASQGLMVRCVYAIELPRDMDIAKSE